MKLFNSNGFVWSPELGATIITVMVLVAIPTTLFLTQARQDTRQQASGNTQSATISADPQSGVYSVGQKFGATIIIDSGTQEFSAAKATIGVSSELAIDTLTITPEIANGCEFTFTDPSLTPNASNPSFYGILPNGNKTKCTVYTLTLTAIKPGQGTIFINDASVLSGTGNVNILNKVNTATFTVTP